MGLLESALGRLQATFEGKELYPDLWSKAAALMHSLIRNHPFVDGNKRMALTATGLFLELNGYQLTTGSESVLAFVRRVVRGDMELGEMASWLEAHSDPLNT